MDKQKSQNTKNLRICAKIVAWIGIAVCFVCLFAAIGSGMASGGYSISELWMFLTIIGIALSTAVSYYTMIVIADISETLHGKIEEPKAKNTVA